MTYMATAHTFYPLQYTKIAPYSAHQRSDSFYASRQVCSNEVGITNHIAITTTNTPDSSRQRTVVLASLRRDGRKTPLLSITHMSNSQLAEQCLQEMRHYREGQEHDDSYCLELFHRAIIVHDEDAWEVLQTTFTPLMHGWLRRHPKHEIACRLDSEENYVAIAFVRFWQATVHNQRVEFHSLAGAMRYLQASLNGAIMDALRAYARPQEMPLPDPGFSDEPMVEDEDELCSSWQVINTILTHTDERRIAYLLFYCGLKPRDIVKHCPQEFPNVRDVYRLRRNIMEKLQRNIELLRWQLL